MSMAGPFRELIIGVAVLAGVFQPSASPGAEMPLIDSPMLSAKVASGLLPPVAERLPEKPMIVRLEDEGKSLGKHGGNLRILMAKPKDVRMMTVYGYTRLVGYTPSMEIIPDILERVDVKNGREFTLHLRKGLRWSDGYPFTTEDFRYYWEEVANNKELAPFGLSQHLLVDGQRPEFEILDELTVRYSWTLRNPNFLPALAGSSPLYIYRPAHYLKRFHLRYAQPDVLDAYVKLAQMRNWGELHSSKDRQYRADNPDLPTLQAWVNTVRPPSEHFIFKRNPYYHRIDSQGRQLPYIDTITMSIQSNKIIPAKTGAGDSDLQARYLRFDNYTFLKEAERRNDFKVRLWPTIKGAQVALYPNLNAKDPGWRKLMREVRFRRALSMAINRSEINQVVYFGLAQESNNTVLPKSPLFRPEYQTAWTGFNLKAANGLLDALGLTRRNSDGVRLMSDGRPLDIIVETSGESTESTDILELIRDSWRKIGIRLLVKPTQREVFRRRIFSGRTIMSVWSGLANGLPTAEMTPKELAPSVQTQLQWPKWGHYIESDGHVGEKPDMEAATELVRLNNAWGKATTTEERRKIWHRMLKIHSDQIFTIGIVNNAFQPVVVSNRLRNVPATGYYNWEPGAYFGIYRPDTFWLADK